jgi:hypothetical protein
MEDKKVSEHYSKYKDTIKKGMKKYLSKPENREKHNQSAKNYRKKRIENYENKIKELEEKLKKIQEIF